MTSIEVPPVPLDPDDIGRDNDTDGTLGSNAYISEVKVINITPHEVSEIKTSVITLEQDIFPVPKFAGDPSTTPISVFSDDVSRGYVQWEPMGDLYPPTTLSPLGSYKYLRVKWDCYLPAGGASVQEPYDYYHEKIYTFRATEPLMAPSFELTPGVLSALGQNGSTKATYFEFSAHGYVNKFNFHNGLYGQDKQTDIPDGSGLIAAKRKVIYDAFYDPVGNINEAPNTQGTECLAKEYTVHGRIVPELDYDGAAFQVIQEGNITNFGNEQISIYGTSGRDAPPFWYNFNYELQHKKNIIPFTFMWGVSLPTYDEGTYDPRGPSIDPQDRFGRVGGTPRNSANHGRRRRSDDWVSYFLQKNPKEAASPNIFHSQDDITFSIVGPDAVCHASSVNVCAVSTESDLAGLKKTVINWFDKANQSWYDVEVFGFNFLPSYSCWVLRGCLHVNNSYLPGMNLTSRDTNSQLSNKLEKTWAIDLNFSNRKLFTAYKNTYIDPPQEFLNRVGRPDFYKNVCEYVCSMWDSDVEVQVTYTPNTVTEINSATNPFYGRPHLESPKIIGFLKRLHDPFASSPMGVAYRPGIQGEQPGFNYVGIGSLLALAGMPDARFLEACIDLEWGRNTIEADRDGSIINQFADPWITKRQVPDFPSITLEPIGWTNKTIDSPEYQGIRNIIENDSILGYVGAAPALNGSEVICNFQRGLDKDVFANLFPPRTLSQKTDNFSRYMPGTAGNGRELVDNKIGHPVSKHQHALGYVNNNLHCNDTKNAFTVAHFAFGHMLSYGMISGDKQTIDLIDHYMRVISITHGAAEHASKIFDRTGGSRSAYHASVAANVGRQEGRPVHILTGGFSVTTNRELAEAVLYKYSRRFWNTVHVTNWEEHPNGYLNKPWRTLWLPPWAGGKDKIINSQGLLREVNIGPVNNAFNSIYRDNYKLGGDLALRAYNMAHIRILDINPLSVSGDAGNRATWDYNVGSSSRSEYPIWRSKWDHADGRTGAFPASGLSAIDGLPGAPNGSVLAVLPHRLYWRYTDVDGDPWGADILTPTPDDPNSPVSSIPGTRVPDDLSEGDKNQVISRLTIAQSYQNSLLFVFIKPFPEQFDTYAKIFRNRATFGLTPSFSCRVSDYSVIADELEDTAIEMNKYFVRAARTISKCVLLKVHENSQSNLGLYGIGYTLAPYSPSRPYDQYLEQERKITLDAQGQGSFPTISQIKYQKNGIPQTHDLILSPDFTAGAYQVALGTVIGKPVGGQYSTIMWASNCVLWAWDAIYAHGDLNDPRNLEALEELKEAITQWYGPEKFNLTTYNQTTNLRNQFYPAVYGSRGFPGVGAEPPSVRGTVGDYELQPWLVGSVEEDVWKNREINTTLKVISNAVIKGSTQASLNNEAFVVISPNRRTYTYEEQPDALFNPGKGLYPIITSQSNIRNALPHSVEKLDFGMSSLYLNGGDSSRAFDWSRLDNLLDLAASRNCQGRIKIFIDYPRALDSNGIPFSWTFPPSLPTFLKGIVQETPYYTLGAYGFSYDTSGLIPDWDSQELRNELFRLVRALGARYDGDPRIAEIQVGLVGHWGEWNQAQAATRNTNGNVISRYVPNDLINELIQVYDESFNQTPITGRYYDQRIQEQNSLPDTPTLLTNPAVNIGQHDDSYAFQSISYSSPRQLWYTYTQVEAYNLQEKLKNVFQSGEIRPEIQVNLDVFRDNYLNRYFEGGTEIVPQNIFDCIEALKTSILSCHRVFADYANNPNNIVTPEITNNINRAIYRLGYNFFIQNANIPLSVIIGQNFNISVNIKNTGVARFFQNWPIAIKFEDQASNSIEIETDWNLSSIQSDSAVDFSYTIDGSLIEQIFPQGATVNAYIRIKNPAAFLRNIVFMNAEHVDSTPYLALGQLNLEAATIKYINASFSGETKLKGNIREYQTYTPKVRDLGNESLFYVMDSPQVTSTGGGGGVTHSIEALIRGSTQLSSGVFTLTSVVLGDIGLRTILFGNFPKVDIVDFTLNLRSFVNLEEPIVLGYSIANLSISGLSQLSVDNLSVFKKLADANISGSQNVEIEKLVLTKPIDFSVVGETNIEAPFSVERILETAGINCSTELSTSFSDLNLVADLRIQTILDSNITIIPISLPGTSSRRDITLNTSVNNLDRQTFNSEITAFDSKYSGLRRSQRMYFEHKLFDELIKKSLSDNNISEIYKETLGSMLHAFSDLVYLNDENKIIKVPCWHGSSERVVAKMKQETNIILPVISVHKTNNAIDIDRRRSSSLIVYDTYWDIEKQRAVRVASLSPAPVNISYRVNVWTKYQEDLDHITEQVHRKFNPDLEIKTKYNTTSKAFMIEESDNAETALPEGQDRVIRKTFTIEVESYIPNPKYLITNTGKIEEYNSEIHIPLK